MKLIEHKTFWLFDETSQRKCFEVMSFNTSFSTFFVQFTCQALLHVRFSKLMNGSYLHVICALFANRFHYQSQPITYYITLNENRNCADSKTRNEVNATTRVGGGWLCFLCLLWMQYSWILIKKNMHCFTVYLVHLFPEKPTSLTAAATTTKQKPMIIR